MEGSQVCGVDLGEQEDSGLRGSWASRAALVLQSTLEGRGLSVRSKTPPLWTNTWDF